MVRYLEQVFIDHHKGLKGNKNQDKNDHANRGENRNYNIPNEKIRRIEKNKDITLNPNQTLCSICKRSDTIVTDPQSGEIICSNCGMVISDKVEATGHSERPRFVGGQIDQTRARTGAPTSLARHDMGLATIIGKEDRDASGQKIDPFTRSTMQRLRKWDFRAQLSTPSDRNLRTAFELLYTLKDKIGLSDSIIEKAAY